MANLLISKCRLSSIIVGVMIMSGRLIEGNSTVSYHSRETNLWPDFLLREYDKPNRYDSMTGFVFGLKVKYPEIIHIESIGKSIEERQIWSIRLSLVKSYQSSDVWITRPNVRYMAGLSGNDMVGREILLQLLHEICLGYEQNNPSVISLLAHTNIYLLPMLNPDAVTRTNEHLCLNRMPRYYKNANNVSLADDLVGLMKLDNGSLLQPEVLALKKIALEHQFVLSLYLEGGGIGHYFPRKYIGGSVNHDNDVFEKLVAHYWKDYKLKPGISDCSPGPVQYDEKLKLNYSYFYGGFHEILLQVECCANIKNTTSWRRTYQANRKSLLNYFQMAHQGIKGKIVSAEDGEPIKKARLFIRDAQFTSDSNGVFRRILLPGNYTMNVEADDYLSTEVQFEVTRKRQTRINFALEEAVPNSRSRYSNSTARDINVNILNNFRLPEHAPEFPGAFNRL